MSANTSDSQSDSASSLSASSSEDEEGAPKTRRMWRPPKSAALEARDPWLAARGPEGSPNQRPAGDPSRLGALIAAVERALDRTAKCGASHEILSGAAGNNLGAPGDEETEDSKVSPFARKVFRQLESLKELQSSCEDPGERGGHSQDELQQSSRCCLHGYQKEGAAWILQRFSAGLNCIVADEMGGASAHTSFCCLCFCEALFISRLLFVRLLPVLSGLGKTLQALSVYVHLRRFGEAPFRGKPALVVCPLSVVGSWAGQCMQFLGAVDALSQRGPQASAMLNNEGTQAAAVSPSSEKWRPLQLMVFVGDASARADIKRRLCEQQQPKTQQQVSLEAGAPNPSCHLLESAPPLLPLPPPAALDT